MLWRKAAVSLSGMSNTIDAPLDTTTADFSAYVLFPRWPSFVDIHAPSSTRTVPVNDDIPSADIRKPVPFLRNVPLVGVIDENATVSDAAPASGTTSTCAEERLFVPSPDVVTV